MQIPLFPISVGSAISKNVSPQECINFYYSEPPVGEAHKGELFPVHGYTTFASMPNVGVVRGMIENRVDGLLYVACDDDFYEVTAIAGITDRGDLASAGGAPLSMAFNPATQEIIIVDGTGGRHFLCTTNTFSTISDSDYPDTASTVAFLNGYFIVDDPTAGAGRFRWSALNDGMTWDAADFTTAESLGGKVVRLHEDRGVLWVMGSHATELWFNTGSEATFERFERISTGIAAPYTMRSFDNSVVWLSQNAQGQYNVVRAGGSYQPEVISTAEVSQLLQSYAEDGVSSVNSSWAFTYTLGGNEFYCLSVANSNLTLAYNARTKLWHRMSGAFSTGVPTRWPIGTMLNWYASGNNILVGGAGFNSGSGQIFQIKQGEYQQAAANMDRRVTGPLIAIENEARLRFSEVQIDIEEGVNLGSETGNDGQLTLTYSKDGGNTYATGVQLELGTSRTHRLIKRKLGTGRLWNFRITTDTPRKIVVKGAYGRTYGEPLGGYATKE